MPTKHQSLLQNLKSDLRGRFSDCGMTLEKSVFGKIGEYDAADSSCEIEQTPGGDP
jgi:hypothetical protein